MLSAIQDAAGAAADPSDAASTALQLVWGLHAVVDGHKANQQALQAAGGLPLITSLLAQASTQPTSETLPVPPSHATPNTPTAKPTQPLQTSELAQSDPARGEDYTAADRQAADQVQLVHALVWLIGSAAAGIPANQLALHQSGAVYLLLHQVQWSKSPAVVTGAMWALASLTKGSADVQSEVQLQVCSWLLNSLSCMDCCPSWYVLIVTRLVFHLSAFGTTYAEIRPVWICTHGNKAGFPYICLCDDLSCDAWNDACPGL